MNIRESLLIFYIAANQENKINVLRQWIKTEINIQRLASSSNNINSLFSLFCGVTRSNVHQSTFALYLNRAKEILSACDKGQIHILTPYDGIFPDHILSIANPPIILFAKGNVNLLPSRLAIAVVGTREPSALGINHARIVAASLVKNNVIVVSGLALGCDSAAHQSVIENHGKTVAVLAHGLDMVYPSQNIKLAEEIIRFGGCLVSEYLPGVQPTQYQFIERDRIQSGISSGIIVIECQESSGTMHTVRACKEQNKFLACIANLEFVDSRFVTGNKQLLQQGAFPIRTEADINVFLEKNTVSRIKRSKNLNDFFKPAEVASSEKTVEHTLSTEVLLRINKNKLKALNIRFSKVEQGADGSLQNLTKAIQETTEEIASLEEKLLEHDLKMSSEEFGAQYAK